MGTTQEDSAAQDAQEGVSQDELEAEELLEESEGAQEESPQAALALLERIPQNIQIKEKFVEHYQRMLGDRYDLFMKFSLSYIRKAIRVNTLKISVEDLKKRLEPRWKLTQIPWCKEGFWIEYKEEEGEKKRFDVGNLIEHALGYIYVQEAASMIPPVVLDPKPGMSVLDLCAAPGSKTSQMASMMQNEGILVANDIQGSRLKALGINIQRCGITNIVITMMQSGQLRKGTMRYDAILIDAPCSGVGTIRKSLKTLQMWSPGLVSKLNRVQRQLVDDAFQMLKAGGTMVYSTCTLEPEENEAVVSHLLERYPDAYLEDIDLPITRSSANLEFEGLKIDPSCSKCLSIHPYDNNTEGFFVARIRKRE